MKKLILLNKSLSSLLVCVVLLTACTQPQSFEERMQSARDYVAEQEYPSAIIELKNALTERPDDIEARRLIADLYFHTGDIVRANNEWKRLLERDGQEIDRLKYVRTSIILSKLDEAQLALKDSAPTDQQSQFEADVLQARIFIETEEIEAAGKYLKRIESFDPTVESLLTMAQYEFANGRDGLGLIGQALDMNPDSRRAWSMRGWTLIGEKDFAEAEDAFSKSIDSNATGEDVVSLARAVIGKVRALLLQDKHESAIDVADQWISKFQDSTTLLYLKGLAHYQKGDLDSAKLALSVVLSERPEDSQAVILMSALQYRQGNFEQARSLAQQALVSEPKNVVALRLLGEIELVSGNADRAYRVLRPLVRSGAIIDQRLLSVVGEAALRSGRTDSGLDYLERGLKQAGSGRREILQYASGLLRASKIDDAINILEPLTVSTQEPFLRESLLLEVYAERMAKREAEEMSTALLDTAENSVQAALFAAEVSARFSDFERALSYAKLAEKQAPEDARVQLTEATLYRTIGDMASALKHAEKAVKLEPNDQGVAVFYATILSEAQRTFEAVEYLEAFSSRNPNSGQALIYLVDLYRSLRRFDDAFATVKRIAAIPEEKEAYLGYAVEYSVQNNRLVYADQYLADLEKITNDRSTYLRLAANVHLAAGRIQRSQDAATAYSKVAANPAQADILIARVDFLAKRYSQVISRLKQTVTNNPEMQRQKLLLTADAHFNLNESAQALALYEQGFEKYGDVLFARRLLNLANDPDGSGIVSRIEAWSTDRADNISVKALLAEYYSANGRYHRAVESYEKLIALPGGHENAEWLNNLAWSYLQLGDVRAVEAARMAYELQRDNPFIKDTYGWTLVKNGRVDQGLAYLQEAAEALSNSPEVLYHLAYAHAEMGANKPALKALEDIRSVDNDHFVATEEVQALYQQLLTSRKDG